MIMVEFPIFIATILKSQHVARGLGGHDGAFEMMMGGVVEWMCQELGAQMGEERGLST